MVNDYFAASAEAGLFQAPYGYDRESGSALGFGYVSLPPVVALASRCRWRCNGAFKVPPIQALPFF
jgi:hypothetical protein